MSGELFSKNAWIDIATNFASFDSIDFSKDFPDFLTGNFDHRHLLTLLHEATHHWCLTTPVGTALAARTFRTYHDAAMAAASLKSGVDFPAERAKLLDASLFASRTLTAFFVPLLEGLALYAEWRAAPSPGGTYSRPFDIFAQLARAGWAKLDPDAASDVEFEGLSEFLRTEDPAERERIVRDWMASDQGHRLDREAVFNLNIGLRFVRTRPEERRRLAQVLSVPVGPECGGYQLGYLFVCALEAIFSAHVSTDALLAYVRDYFFQDYDLAALILDEEVDYYEMYSILRKTLQSKVEQLIKSPADSEAALRTWAESREDAPVVVTSVDDFFGRDKAHANAPEDGSGPEASAFQLYSSRFDAFCLSMGGDEIYALILRNFLLAGRVLMPLGARDFVAVALDKDRLSLHAEDGLEMLLPVGKFSVRPAVGDAVTLSMLVNVASPGAAVSVRWGENFEVLPLIDDPISKVIIENVYYSAEVIRGIIFTGQKVIEHLHRETIDGFERIEDIPETLINMDSTRLDILQIYRAAIIRAFVEETPMITTPQWRREKFAAWEPRGISTLLDNRDMLDLFLKICGMPIDFYFTPEQLRAHGVAESEEEIERIGTELFELLNRISKADYDAAIAPVKAKFEAHGLRMFAETLSGTFVSLV